MTDDAQLLVREIDALLSSPTWQIFRESRSSERLLYVAAGLRHVSALLDDLFAAASQGREISVRILGRAHFEAWLVAMYLVAFSDDAVTDLKDSYLAASDKQRSSIDHGDRRLRSEQRTARKKNKRIRKVNEDRTRHNETRPGDPPLALREELPVPQRRPVDLTDEDFGGPYSKDVAELPLGVVVERLSEWGQSTEGPDAVFYSAYDIACRGLSNLGAHATLKILSYYLDLPPRQHVAGTCSQMARETSMVPAILPAGVMITAVLSDKVASVQGQTIPLFSPDKQIRDISQEAEPRVRGLWQCRSAVT